jgi:hypothetical protein
MEVQGGWVQGGSRLDQAWVQGGSRLQQWLVRVAGVMGECRLGAGCMGLHCGWLSA